MCCHNIITGNCQINLANAPDVNKFFFIREQKISENKAVHGSQTPVRVFPGQKASFFRLFTGLAAFPGLEGIFFQDSLLFSYFSRSESIFFKILRFSNFLVTVRISGFTVTKVYMQPHFSQPDARSPRDPVANVAGQRRAEQLHSDLENNLRIAFS